MISVQLVGSLVIIIFLAVFFIYDYYLLIKKLKKYYPRGSTVWTVYYSEISKIIENLEIYDDKQLLIAEAEVHLLESDSTFFEKSSDSFFKVIIGISISLFAGLTTMSISSINFIKDNVSKDEFIENINSVLDLFIKIGENYNLIYLVALLLFAVTTYYYLDKSHQQKQVRKHISAIETLKKLRENH